MILFQATGSFSADALPHSDQHFPRGFQSIVFFTALIGVGTRANIVPWHRWLLGIQPIRPTSTLMMYHVPDFVAAVPDGRSETVMPRQLIAAYGAQNEFSGGCSARV